MVCFSFWTGHGPSYMLHNNVARSMHSSNAVMNWKSSPLTAAHCPDTRGVYTYIIQLSGSSWVFYSHHLRLSIPIISSPIQYSLRFLHSYTAQIGTLQAKIMPFLHTDSDIAFFEHHFNEAVIVNSLFLGLGILSVGLRLYNRYKSTESKSWGWDDYLILPALVSFVISTGFLNGIVSILA